MIYNIFFIFILSILIASLVSFFVFRFSPMALLENQLEGKIQSREIGAEAVFNAIEHFSSLRSRPCCFCKQDHFWYSWIFPKNPCSQVRFFPQFFLVFFLFLVLSLFLNKLSWSFDFAICCFLICLFSVITIIDWRYYIIPDEINWFGTFCGVSLNLAVSAAGSFQVSHPFITSRLHLGVENTLLGILIGSGTLFCIAWVTSSVLNREAMGGGDIKLMIFIGSFLGYKSSLLVLGLSSVIGSVFGLIAIIKSRVFYKNQGFTMIAYGPYLILAALIVLYFGEKPILLAYENFSLEMVRYWSGIDERALEGFSF